MMMRPKHMTRASVRARDIGALFIPTFLSQIRRFSWRRAE